MSKNNNRYFIVTYFAETSSKRVLPEEERITTHQGQYINKKETIQFLINDGHINPVIFNIIELNEKDFKEYTKNFQGR